LAWPSLRHLSVRDTGRHDRDSDRDGDARGSGEAEDSGLADVQVLQRRAAAQTHAVDEQGFYLETVSEYLWARDVAGFAPRTLEKLVRPVMELCSFYDLVPWRLTPRHVDQFHAGQGRRARSTVRSKLTKVDSYFAFLEQRYAGEIARRFGATVESPVDTQIYPITDLPHMKAKLRNRPEPWHRCSSTPSAVRLRNATPQVFHQHHIGRVLRSS
jgi:hypothetical protein